MEKLEDRRKLQEKMALIKDDIMKYIKESKQYVNKCIDRDDREPLSNDDLYKIVFLSKQLCLLSEEYDRYSILERELKEIKQ